MKARLDAWTVVSDAPTRVPFELRPVGSVFRGFMSFRAAEQYVGEVNSFFAGHGVDERASVVHGPTSTTPCKYEVVTATCGYMRAGA